MSVPVPLEISHWPKDESVPLIDHTVGSLLAERSGTHADTVAIVGMAHGSGEERRITYRELYREARGAAAGLLRLAEPGEHVALWAPNVIEWPIIQYGAALAGLVLVALNPGLRQDELAYILENSDAVVLLHADRNRDEDLGPAAAAMPAVCPGLRHVVSLSERERWTAAPDGLPDPAELRPEAPVMLQYTSGTTARPKGVLLSNRSLVNVAKLTLDTAEVPEGVVAVSPLPTFHTAGCVISTLGPLWLGGTMVLVGQFQPDAVLDLIEREGARLLFGVPTVLIAVLEAARRGGGRAPRLDTVLVGAANVPGPVIEAAKEVFGASVHNLFGQTELAPVLSMTRRNDPGEDVVSTVGRPVPQVECKIVDPATGEVQPLGVAGEICARGYQQLMEYYRDPVNTAQTVDAGGWVHTGDLGAMDARGVITLTGRLRDLIIRGGENIAPAEIESCLAAHDAVLDAVVLGVPDERLGEKVAAVVRLRDETADPREAEESLLAHCRQRLARYKVPQRWFFVTEFPMTASGKIPKFVLRDSIVEGDLIQEGKVS
jgi:fatty-acyl-CoA synthase/long-chain acyl-CoA synthetase